MEEYPQKATLFPQQLYPDKNDLNSLTWRASRVSQVHL